MALKKAYSICDHGTAEHHEDGYIAQYPLYAVIDGLSEPHSYKNPLKLFNGLSGGEMIVEVVKKVFSSIYPQPSLEEYVLIINNMIQRVLETEGFSIKNAGLIPGASFVFAKIEDTAVRILQGGDCLAVWRFASGEIGFIPNQAYRHVSQNLQTIHEILARNEGNRKEMWVEFYPILSQRRQRDINNSTLESGYAVLNGQPNVVKCWQKREIPIRGLNTLLLFSDGFVPYYETSDEKMEQLAERLLNEYKDSEYKDKVLTLKEMLERKRREKSRKGKPSYIKHDEATALVLEFDNSEEPEKLMETIKALLLEKKEGNFFI